MATESDPIIVFLIILLLLCNIILQILNILLILLQTSALVKNSFAKKSVL